MTIAITEHTAPAELIALLNRIRNDRSAWGVATVRRDYMRTVTNEAFALAINPILQEAAQAHLFFPNERSIYIVWNGRQKAIYISLRNFICASLMRAGLDIDPQVLVAYDDPRHNADKVATTLGAIALPPAPKPEDRLFDEFPDTGDVGVEPVENDASTLHITPEQIDIYEESCRRKTGRRQLQLLVIEDQIFSQKLLCELLRDVRARGYPEPPSVETATGVQDGWKIFLRKAPDIAFIDLNLADGSGHALVRAIKDLDPRACVIIVTANNYEGELGVARRNNVEGFIAKPYNKKQIVDCILTYATALKPGRGEAQHGYGRRL